MTAQKINESPEPTLYDVVDIMRIGFDRVEGRFDALEANVASFREEVKGEFAAFRQEVRQEHKEIHHRLARLALYSKE